MSGQPDRSRGLRSRLRSGTGVRLGIVLVLAAVVAAVALSPELRVLERDLLIELSGLGGWALPVLVLGYVLLSLLLLPVFPLDMAAGAHFGLVEGVLWVQVAATVAAMPGYLLGKTVLRGFVDRQLAKRPRLRGIRRACERDGWRVVFLSRLSPVLSFSLLNVLCGAVGVPFRSYVLASFAGMLPGTLLYVYAGEIAGDLSGASAHPDPPAWTHGYELAGFLATIAVVVLLTRLATRRLATTLD